MQELGKSFRNNEKQRRALMFPKVLNKISYVHTKDNYNCNRMKCTCSLILTEMKLHQLGREQLFYQGKYVDE